jgi:hypothetical protein
LNKTNDKAEDRRLARATNTVMLVEELGSQRAATVIILGLIWVRFAEQAAAKRMHSVLK